MKSEIEFFSNKLKLEGILYSPEEGNSFSAAVVTHPHPQFGGSMYNNVVDAVCEELEKTMVAMKFNCRGVGRSEGVSTGGQEEWQDVEAAIKFLKTHELVDPERIVFIGYSWGTYVGLPVTYDNPDIKVIIAISCPVGMWNYGYLKNCQKPILLTVGKRDQFAPFGKIKKLFDTIPEPKELFLLEADHFYIGYEHELTTKVAEFVKKNL